MCAPASSAGLIKTFPYAILVAQKGETAMRYDILLLDADGTLLDFARCERSALDAALTAFHLPTGDAVAQRYSQINRSLWEAYEQGKLEKTTISHQRFAQLLGEMGSTTDPYAVAEAYRAALSRGYFLLPGALQVCRTLARRARLYLVTNGVSSTQFARLAGSGLLDLMRGVFVSEDAGAPKPSPDYFSYAFARIPDFSRDRALLVGDSLTSDMAGGAAAGVDTAWYNPSLLPLPASYRVTFQLASLDQLPGLAESGHIPAVTP